MENQEMMARIIQLTEEHTTFKQIPLALREGLVRYALFHIRPGGFLQAVLENDLAAALARADPDSRQLLYEIILFIYRLLPGGCYGSRAKVEKWLSTNPKQINLTYSAIRYELIADSSNE